jgi:hypothetical protein
MSAIPLKIFMHGLMALVPSQDPGVNSMVALLVDGRMQMQGECMMEHHPKLTFFVAKTADCVKVPGCTVSGDQCTCKHDTAKGTDPLVGKQIWFETSPQPNFPPDRPAGDLPPPGKDLPDSSDEAAKFYYVANMSQAPFGLKLDTIYLAKNPSPAARTHLAARMELPYTSLTSCALATREDGGVSNVHSMSFRKLHTASKSDEKGYALAQKVIAEVTFPDAGSGKQSVTLHISDFNGAGGPTDHALKLKPGPDAYRVDLGNDPEVALDRDDPCDDGVARHFSQFYDLALTVPDEELIPHVKPTRSAPWTDLEPKACKDPVFGLADRPICPLVTFNPQASGGAQ